MTHYRFYFLTANGLIKLAEDRHAADDQTAVALAIALDDARAVELWSGQRLVGTVEPKTGVFHKGKSGAQTSDVRKAG